MKRLSSKSLAFPLTLAMLAGVVFFGLTAFMRRLERRAIENPAIRDQLVNGRVRPLADVARTVARLNLVTAEVETCVATRVSHDNWRGAAVATVEAPVVLHYGIDVSQVRSDHIEFSPAGNSYIIRIPPPRRMATEVLGGQETVDVQVGWARLRSRAGEYYLGLARKSLYESARELALSPEDARTVRETSIAQVGEAVRRFVGDDAWVKVVVDESLGSVQTANSTEAP